MTLAYYNEIASMRFAYADPPYLGQGKKLYKHPEWDNLATHAAFIARLHQEFPDGWVLSASLQPQQET